MSEFVDCHLDRRGVYTLTLNRSDRHNAFDDQIIRTLTEQLQRVETDPAARVLVLAAAGKSFSAGADAHWMRRMAGYSEAENRSDARALAAMLDRLNTLRVPTVARVQGAAFGGAVGLICCCDMAIAAPPASFSFSEVKLGLLPATISPYVIAAIGERAARRYFLTGERFDAHTAYRLGLVNDVVEADDLDSAVDALVELLLKNGPHAMAESKKLIREVAGRPIDAELREITSQWIARLRVSREGQEGLQAFLEKRKPKWQE